LIALFQIFHEKKKDDGRNANNNNQSDEEDTPNLEAEENTESPLTEVLA